MPRAIARRVLLKKNPRAIVKRKSGTTGTRTGRAPHLYAFLKRRPEARILIIQPLSGLGDQMMVLPLLRTIKEMFPQCHLGLAYYRKGKGKSGDIYYDILRECPWVDSHENINSVNRGAYDYWVDVAPRIMQRETSGKKGRIDYFREACGFPKPVNSTPFYHETADEKLWAMSVRNRYPGKVVALHVDSEEIRRSWPPERYVELVRKAAVEQPSTTFWVFDFNNRVKDWKNATNIQIWSQSSVREMASLVRVADVYVGPDSGPMHVAAAVGTQSVIVFGPIPNEARITYYPTHEALQATELDCCPCWYRTCPFALKCLKSIDVQRVFDAYTRLL